MTKAKASYVILCAVDGSEGSNTALDLVAELPLRARDRVIVASHPAYLFMSTPDAPPPVAAHLAAERAKARDWVDAAVARLAARGVTADGVICDPGDDTVDALIRCAEHHAASLLVAGSRGRGPWSSILLGSTARALAILSPVPLLIARRARPPLRVIVASDGCASGALSTAFAALPQSEGCTVELLQVLPPHDRATDAGGSLWDEMARRTEMERDEEGHALRSLERERARLPRGIDARVHVERGHPGLTILARAKRWDADLIVVGTRDPDKPRQFFFGSTAERVVTQCATNVLVVPQLERRGAQTVPGS